MTIRAIFEDGVFRPLDPVDSPTAVVGSDNERIDADLMKHHLS